MKSCNVTDFTYKSVEHLVEHRSQTPPVHRAVVRLLLENLGGQVLRGEQQQGLRSRLTFIICWWRFCIDYDE